MSWARLYRGQRSKSKRAHCICATFRYVPLPCSISAFSILTGEQCLIEWHKERIIYQLVRHSCTEIFYKQYHEFLFFIGIQNLSPRSDNSPATTSRSRYHVNCHNAYSPQLPEQNAAGNSRPRYQPRYIRSTDREYLCNLQYMRANLVSAL